MIPLSGINGKYTSGMMVRREKIMNHEFQFVAAVHGNESLPHTALNNIGEEHVVGNPLALLFNRRYVHRDLNASFGTIGLAYEQLRAPQVLRQLDGERFVIDFHTFSCDSPPFAIVVDLAMSSLAASLRVEHVVYMKHNIKKGHALINYRDGGSYDLAQAIVNRLKTDGFKPKPVRIFEVFGRIEKPGNYANLVESLDGFVPILYGEKAYIKQGFYGLKAREMRRLP